VLSRTSRTGGQSNRRWGSKAIRIGHSLEDSSLRTRKTALSAEILLGSPKTSRSISERNSRKIRLRCIFRRTLASLGVDTDSLPFWLDKQVRLSSFFWGRTGGRTGPPTFPRWQNVGGPVPP